MLADEAFLERVFNPPDVSAIRLWMKLMLIAEEAFRTRAEVSVACPAVLRRLRAGTRGARAAHTPLVTGDR